ncbi:GTP cyclohydrolase FolE2 [Amycolatopsis japonica]
MTLEDVQGRPDTRGIALDEAGVSDLRYPITLADRDGAKQESIGQFKMSVAVPAEAKGTHMSRFVEILHEHATDISVVTLPVILDAICQRLATEHAHLQIRATYFRERSAPVSHARSLVGYDAVWSATVNGASTQLELEVQVPVTSVCPCSKAISDYGAHNQRGHITIRARQAGSVSILWIEDLVDIAENSASAPVYPLLKRPDERYVTMQAYDNPVFVEDMVRNVATQLHDDPRVAAFYVHASNDESIHDHAAFASVTWPRTNAALDQFRWEQ